MDSKVRKEKIEILRKVISGKLSLNALAPKIKLSIFERSPGLYEGIILQPPAGQIICGGATKNLATLVTKVKRQCKRHHPNRVFEYGVMPFEECERLRKFAEREF